MGDAGFTDAHDVAESPSGEHSFQTHPSALSQKCGSRQHISKEHRDWLLQPGIGLEDSRQKKAWVWSSIGNFGGLSSHWLLKAQPRLQGESGHIYTPIGPSEKSKVYVRSQGVQDRAEEERTELLASHSPMNPAALPATP